MSMVIDFVRSRVPVGYKTTPNGWYSGNCPMCIHNGQPRNDTRKRGGFHFDSDSFQYNCFNCGFKAGWSEGRSISPRLQQLLELGLGVDRAEVQRLKLELVRDQELRHVVRDNVEVEKPLIFDWPEKPLPVVAHSLYDWGRHFLDSGEDPTDYAKVLEYATSRQFTLEDKRLYWCNNAIHGLNKRLLIPFTYKGKSVGYTARLVEKASDTIPKYFMQQPRDFVFNLDSQKRERKYLIVVEGPIDALHLDGVAICGSQMSETQARIIEKYSINKQIIAVPDRDKASKKFVNSALKRNWNVSFPPWEDSCKDIGDAVNKYGRLFTLKSVLSSVYDNSGKIKVLTKKYCK